VKKEVFMRKYWQVITLIAVLGLTLAACASPSPAPTPTDPPVIEEGIEAETEDEDAGDMDGEDQAPVIDAAGIYSTRCARCHAADRSGNNGPALLPERLTKDTSAYVATITNGSGPMPSFGNRLSAEEISALVDFILSEPQ
jgi:mono/diheme cytochrome c family protein